jgi:hypothetical protein
MPSLLVDVIGIVKSCSSHFYITSNYGSNDANKVKTCSIVLVAEDAEHGMQTFNVEVRGNLKCKAVEEKIQLRDVVRFNGVVEKKNFFDASSSRKKRKTDDGSSVKDYIFTLDDCAADCDSLFAVLARKGKCYASAAIHPSFQTERVEVNRIVKLLDDDDDKTNYVIRINDNILPLENSYSSSSSRTAVTSISKISSPNMVLETICCRVIELDEAKIPVTPAPFKPRKPSTGVPFIPGPPLATMSPKYTKTAYALLRDGDVGDDSSYIALHSCSKFVPHLRYALDNKMVVRITKVVSQDSAGQQGKLYSSVWEYDQITVATKTVDNGSGRLMLEPMEGTSVEVLDDEDEDAIRVIRQTTTSALLTAEGKGGGHFSKSGGGEEGIHENDGMTQTFFSSGNERKQIVSSIAGFFIADLLDLFSSSSPDQQQQQQQQCSVVGGNSAHLLIAATSPDQQQQQQQQCSVVGGNSAHLLAAATTDAKREEKGQSLFSLLGCVKSSSWRRTNISLRVDGVNFVIAGNTVMKKLLGDLTVTECKESGEKREILIALLNGMLAHEQIDAADYDGTSSCGAVQFCWHLEKSENEIEGEGRCWRVSDVSLYPG